MSLEVLSVAGLSKKYCRDLRRSLRYGLADMAAELLRKKRRASELRVDEFWALKDVSFNLGAGKSLAVIGRNGAGKSTLIRILSGLLKPDAGEARIRGRVGSIIELGAGLDPLLTGRENILLGATYQGLSPGRVIQLVDEIVDFAGLDEFIDSPLQSYSSGMKARLAYGLAAHTRPDLLLVDEVLAVGDVNFQRKCVNHMRRYLEEGGSLLFISHNVLQTQALCERAILLERGSAVFEGDVAEAVNRMLEARDPETPEPPDDDATSGIRITGLRVEPFEGSCLRSGGAARVVLDYEARESFVATWLFSIWTADRWVCIGASTDLPAVEIRAGAGTLQAVLDKVPLVGGRYRVQASILDRATYFPLARYGNAGKGVVVDIKTEGGSAENLRMATGHLTKLEARPL